MAKEIKDEIIQEEENEFAEALALAEELLKDPNKVRINMDFTDLEEGEEADDEVIEKTDDGKVFSDKMYLRLKMALDRVKKYYSDLRNYLTRYTQLTFHSNKSGDVYLIKNKVILRVTVFSRALKVYLALNPKDVDPKYHTVNMIEKNKKKYSAIPVMIRVSSDRSYKYLEELLLILAKKHKLKDANKQMDIDYVPQLQSTSQEIIKMLGYDDILTPCANVISSAVLPNSVAKNAQILITNPYKTKEEKEIYEITVGELSQAFRDKYDVDLPLLKKVGLAPDSATHLKVLAKGDCRYKVSIKANDYDLEALKMILITGGNVVKFVN